MVETLNTKIVKDTFDKVYTEEQFKLFIKDLLIGANFEKEQMIQPLPSEYKDFIRSAKRICKYEYESVEYADTKVLDVLVVKLKRTSSIDRARTAQRNFIARYLNGSRNYQKDAALVAFISEDENGNISPDWRFSLVQMNYVTKFVETSNGKKKLKTEVELTPAKRFSFLVGANEDTHTAQAQFRTCLDKASKGERITIEDLVQAFDIEKVSKEFFDKYKNLFIKMRDELQRLCNVDPIVKNDFITHNVNIDDFAKKTLGQLVFLYFIQKKGWLGVKRDQDWGSGDKKFLRKLFDKYPEFNANYDNFFNDILEHLFYEALASDRGQAAWFDRLNCRIPFLNGGLFEPVNGYEYQKTDLTINNSIFKEIFDTFDLYNFTVKEDEPLEKEVAIDPEMLGKVFENLLPENIRKGNGAFYTPREIVHYMCQESLINYIYNKVNIKEVPLTLEEREQQLKLLKTKKEKEQLKLTHEVIEEIISKQDIEHFIKKGGSNYSNRNVKEELPVSISQNANVLDNALAVIKVCDPAIGSGAFPVGMMNEIVRARATLSPYLNQPERPVYELKRNAIENSIYGVDIDPGAVDIAKLRFWLSLVVDEEDVKNIKPLPNLDYKIMQGNSLITSYEGIDFDEIIDEYKPNTQLMMNLWGDKTQDLKLKLKNKQSEFLKTPYATRKVELKHEIEDTILELVKEKLEIKAKEGKINLQEVQEKIRNFAQNTENRNFFPWKLFFSDAFDNGGFDVVIGNPPYVKIQNIDKNEASILKNKFKTASGKFDLYVLFVEKAFSLMNSKGIIYYIHPHRFLTADYGKAFKTFLQNYKGLKRAILFGVEQIFETATTYTGIFGYSMNNNHLEYCPNYNECLSNIEFNLKDYSCFDNTFWNISSNDDENSKILNKIYSAPLPLMSICEGIYQGIVTLGDDIFILEKRQVNSDHTICYSKKIEDIVTIESEILKPTLKGENIRRYKKCNSDLLVFYPHKKDENGKTVPLEENEMQDKFPMAYQYISQFKDYLKDKKVKYKTNPKYWYSLHRARQQYIFEQYKLITPQLQNIPHFTFDKNNWFPDAGGYSLILKNSNERDYLYLLGILNSEVFMYFIKNTSNPYNNNYYYFKTQYIEPFRLPLCNELQKESISNLVSTILEDKENNKNTDELEKQINLYVYKLYNLLFSEVKTIDPEFSMSEEEYNNYPI